MAKQGYVNGSDLLLEINGKCVGHCTSHSTTFNSETKDRAVKPLSTAAITKALFKGKGVTGLSVSISGEGLCNYDESELSFKDLIVAWKTAMPVSVKAYERKDTSGGTTPTPYLTGSFVITSLDHSAPAEDDATYSISLENDGEVTINEAGITINEG